MAHAIISDIHGNLPALRMALELIGKDPTVICLGDVVGYGASPSECLQAVRERAAVCLQGNHERMLANPSLRIFANEQARKAIDWTEDALDKAEKTYLESLLATSSLDDGILFVHGSPRHPDEYIFDRNTVRDSLYAMEEMGVRLCFFGHTHIPAVYDDTGKDLFREGREIIFEPGRRYLINPGSIGQPRDRDSRGSYCLFEKDKNTVRFVRFEYDIEKASDLILSKGLPAGLATRLFYGM